MLLARVMISATIKRISVRIYSYFLNLQLFCVKNDPFMFVSFTITMVGATSGAGTVYPSTIPDCCTFLNNNVIFFNANLSCIITLKVQGTYKVFMILFSLACFLLNNGTCLIFFYYVHLCFVFIQR